MRSLFNNPFHKLGLSWLRVKELKHLPAGKLRSQNFLGGTIRFIDPAEFLHGVKEIFVDELYRQPLSPSPYIIDCGANIGLSIIYIKTHYPGASILAFEPDDQNFQLLEQNVHSYGFKDVALRKEAVWIKDTQLNFASSGSMSSHISEEGGTGTKMVNAIRLRDYLDRPVDFLKIDIEGAEYAVLGDIKDRLSVVKNMFLEYHGNFSQSSQLTEMLKWINDQGFSYYIKEAAPVFATPFQRESRAGFDYDVQLNIFCLRTDQV